jgi:hypothetical protein
MLYQAVDHCQQRQRVLEEKMGRLAWILIKTCTAMQEYMPVSLMQ